MEAKEGIYFVNEKEHTIGRILHFDDNLVAVETLKAYDKCLLFNRSYKRTDDKYFDDCVELNNRDLAEITFDDYDIAYHRVQGWGLHGNSCFKNS